MNLFAVQLDSVWEDKQGNFSKVRALLAGTPPAAGSLVVLPEMFATGFSLNTELTRRGEPEETQNFMAELARKHGVFVMGGVVNKDAQGRAQNESITVGPDGTVIARYAKIHPFSGAGEAEAHAAGREVVTFGWGGFTVAPFVCYDLRFPEIFRTAARRGADLFVVIACWPVKRQQHWLTLLQARAIENQAFVVGVNRTGAEPRFSYAGHSVVVDPQGVIIADAGEAERVQSARLDAAEVAAWRRDFPALRDAKWRE